MNAKEINNNQFKEAIRVAFSNDNDVFALYCPLVEVQNVDDIVNDISKRIGEDGKEATIKGVYEKSKLVGYYVYDKHTLVSFALNVEYRTRKYLNNLFSLIRSDLKGRMQCYLWSKNIRAIKYLCKQGMKIGNTDELLTHLIL